jgi:hypothetical protein
MDWFYQSFGLFHNGSAYVCVVRRKMSPAVAMDLSAAACVERLARLTGVVHNDGHWRNVAWWLVPATGERQFEAFDLERASWYGCNGAYPPLAFLEGYDQACSGPAADEQTKHALQEQAAQAGLHATRRHFMQLASPGRIFQTAFDGRVFEQSPTGCWPPSMQRRQ